MASTRINYDESRTVNRLERSTNPGRYVLDVPGNGEQPYYIADSYVRMQRWGANRMTNVCDIESQLFNITKPLTRCGRKIEPVKNTSKIHYPTVNASITEQPRTSLPAWLVRDNETMVDPKVLFMDPQENVAMAFQNNVATRLLEKDFFRGV